MPEDRGYNYLLVCVDTITGLTDAVPLKTKEAEETLEGFKKMFNKADPLPKPKWSIQLDEGGEFKSVVKKYLDYNGISVRYGKVDKTYRYCLKEWNFFWLGLLPYKKVYFVNVRIQHHRTSW